MTNVICRSCGQEIEQPAPRLKIRGEKYKVVLGTGKAHTRKRFVVKKPKIEVLECDPIPMLVVVRAKYDQ